MSYTDYLENKTHGTPDFPLEYYYVDEKHPNYEMPFHWHNELEISLILRGSYTFYLNDEIVTAHAGDVVFIDQGIIHGGAPDHCAYECVVFDLQPLLPHIEVCKNCLAELTDPNTHIHSHFPAGSHPICEDTQRLMDACKLDTGEAKLAVLIELYRWFMTILTTGSYTQMPKTASPDPLKMQVLKPVLMYIGEHYMHPITLNELASLANLSVSYFCRLFKSLINKTPIDYLIYYRLERSCYLLAATTLPLAEVAYRCGFNDVSYYIHLFKKSKAITPFQYRKQHMGSV